MNVTFQPQGQITRKTFSTQKKALDAAIDRGVSIVDLSLVDSVDSSVLALWVESRRRKPDLKWQSLPSQMLSIASLVGIDLT